MYWLCLDVDEAYYEELYNVFDLDKSEYVAAKRTGSISEGLDVSIAQLSTLSDYLASHVSDPDVWNMFCRTYCKEQWIQAISGAERPEIVYNDHPSNYDFDKVEHIDSRVHIKISDGASALGGIVIWQGLQDDWKNEDNLILRASENYGWFTIWSKTSGDHEDEYEHSDLARVVAQDLKMLIQTSLMPEM